MPPAAYRRSVVVLAVSLLLGACGQSSPTPSTPPSTPSAVVSPTPEATSTDRPTQAPTGEPTPTPAATLYAVKVGDTLSSIARTWGTTVAQLQAWNVERYPSLAENPNVLEPGW